MLSINSKGTDPVVPAFYMDPVCGIVIVYLLVTVVGKATFIIKSPVTNKAPDFPLVSLQKV